MKLVQLNINKFKNNEESSIELSPRINIFVGENGAGKTNILESVYYLSFCKSPFNPSDKQNIKHGENFFMIKGDYIREEESIDKVHINYKAESRKVIKRNDKEYDRIADHIGEFPLVMISPSDSNLIYGGSEDRRKYIDGVISQFDRSYLRTLLNYNKILQQRNAFLKTLAENHRADRSLLEVFDQKLCQHGTEIHSKRKEFLTEFIPLIQNYYKFISNEKETAGINYKSQLNDNEFCDLLKQNQDRDIILRHSSKGIHRDDLVFQLDGFPVKNFGSQGQQKSFLVALKIAQFEYTYAKKSYKPLLLLDDIFDKLDIIRVEQLMKLVSRNEFGQIFISDTNQERINLIFENIDVEKRIFIVDNGSVNLYS
jgi:DNA replication and repair protein RecF